MKQEKIIRILENNNLTVGSVIVTVGTKIGNIYARAHPFTGKHYVYKLDFSQEPFSQYLFEGYYNEFIEFLENLEIPD